jgi:predicted transcriptional regulator
VEHNNAERDESSNAERILSFIQENPGCHMRKIKKELNLSMGTVQYHVDRLEKMGRIVSNRYGLYKYHFPVGIFGDREKELLQVLNQETAREILMFIIEQRNPTQTDIVNKIGISAASVNWHLTRLIDSQIIDEIREGKFKRYQLRGNSKYFGALLRNYYPNIWDKWSNRLAEIFLSMSADGNGEREENE